MISKQRVTDIIACDFSFRRPGFALLRYDPKNRKATIQETSNINNKNSKKKCDGEILSEIALELKRYLDSSPEAIIVREKALDKTGGIRGARVIEVLHKVVGVADYLAWRSRCDFFEEIHPKTIKKIISNDSNAEKDVVMNSLVQFVGEYDYECDDESDAVAVGIAWLIEKGMIDSPYQDEEDKRPKRPARGAK